MNVDAQVTSGLGEWVSNLVLFVNGLTRVVTRVTKNRTVTSVPRLYVHMYCTYIPQLVAARKLSSISGFGYCRKLVMTGGSERA